MPDDLGKTQVETLLAHTRLAVAATDRTGQMTVFSSALQELLGVTGDVGEDEMVAYFDLFAADGVTRLRTDELPLARARRGEIVTDAVVCSRRGDRLVHLRCNAAPLRADDDHEIVGAIVLVQDVSAEHSAQLEQEELRDRLVVTINRAVHPPSPSSSATPNCCRSTATSCPVGCARRSTLSAAPPTTCAGWRR